MSTISEIKEEKDKEGGFYVVEGIWNMTNIFAW